MPQDAPFETLFDTHLALPARRQGKVRDVYQLPAEAAGGPPRLLIVATDRISAFDVVMPTPIPGKGRLLTEISVRWFNWLRGLHLVADHLLGTEVDALPLPAPAREELRGRIMICRAASVIPFECVVRGYLAGSGWAEYRQRGSVCGVPLPSGLRQGDRLPEPIFTPATKAVEGHDENIDFERMSRALGAALAGRLRSVSLEIYRHAAVFAENRGVLLADTKFEFGFAQTTDGEHSDELLLIDEALTPDSSRFWPRESWQPGGEQPSFDKQYLREWLLRLVADGAWDRSPPGPEIPPEVVHATRQRYQEARRRLWAG